MSEHQCDLCGDVGTLHLHSKCHPTAPLRAEIDRGVLSLFCYVPQCNRLVGRFSLAEVNADLLEACKAGGRYSDALKRYQDRGNHWRHRRRLRS